MAKANSRRSQLEASHSLQQFLRDTEETKNWISEKIKIATDENYKVGCQYIVLEDSPSTLSPSLSPLSSPPPSLPSPLLLPLSPLLSPSLSPLSSFPPSTPSLLPPTTLHFPLLPPLPPPQDPTNQEAKLQQHQAFEAELQANKGRIDAVMETTEELIEAGHYAADVIRWAEFWKSPSRQGRVTCALSINTQQVIVFIFHVLFIVCFYCLLLLVFIVCVLLFAVYCLVLVY